MPVIGAIILGCYAFGSFMYGAGALADGLAKLFETDVFKDWWFRQQGTGAGPTPLLSPDIAPLFMQYQDQMHMLYQLDSLLKSVS